MDGSEARNQAPGGKAAATLESARVASGRSSSSSVALSGGRVGGEGSVEGEGGGSRGGGRGQRGRGRGRGAGGPSSSSSPALSPSPSLPSPPSSARPPAIVRRNDEAIVTAARRGDLAEVRRLYEDGVSLDSTDNNGGNITMT